MNTDYLKEYEVITKGCPHPPVYISSEKQGESIRRCTILKVTNIGYSNRTALKNPENSHLNLGVLICS